MAGAEPAEAAAAGEPFIGAPDGEPSPQTADGAEYEASDIAAGAGPAGGPTQSGSEAGRQDSAFRGRPVRPERFDRGDRPVRPGGFDRRPPFDRDRFRPEPRDAFRPPAHADEDLVGEGEEIVAGRHPVEEAFLAKRPAHRLLVVPQRRQALEKLVLHATRLRIPIVEVEGGTLTSLAGFDGHQGIALVADARKFATLDDILDRARERRERPFVLVLDSLEDPQNFGTLLRTAETAGVHGVVFPTRHQAPLSPAAVKASAGAVEHLLLAPVDDLPDALADLHARGLRVLGSEAEAPLTARETDLRGPVVVVVGSEGQGLGPAIRRRCDALVRIPMRGHIASLNAAVAGSILLYEASSQRGGESPAPTADAGELPEATAGAEAGGEQEAPVASTAPEAALEAAVASESPATAQEAPAASDAPSVAQVAATAPEGAADAAPGAVPGAVPPRRRRTRKVETAPPPSDATAASGAADDLEREDAGRPEALPDEELLPGGPVPLPGGAPRPEPDPESNPEPDPESSAGEQPDVEPPAEPVS